MNKRIVAILLVFTMLISVMACGYDEKVVHMHSRAMDEIDFGEPPVTITYMTIGDKPTNGRTEEAIDRLNKILLKRLNAKLDIFYVSWNDYLKNYNRTLESEDISVDLVGTGTDWLDAWPNIIKGNFMPLSEEMLRKYCGLTYTNVTKVQWSEGSYEGNIYLIPENEYTQWTNHGFVYRKDLAREAGLSEVASWEDLDIYFRNVVSKHPDMIPWDFNGNSGIATLGYLMSSMRYVPIYELTTYGIWGEDLDNKGRIISPYYTGDELIEYARLMKKWNEMGVWRSNLSQAGNNEDEFYNGESSVIQHHTQNYYTIIQPTMDVAMPEVQLGFYWFGRDSGTLMRVSNFHGAMAVSAKSKNPERALMVYDMIRNDSECYRLLKNGIEGIQYELTKDGMLERPSGYNENKDGIVTNFWWGRRDEYEIPDSSYSWDEYYSLVDSYEHIAIDYPWDGVPFSTPQINEELGPIVAIFDKYIPQLSTGQYDETPEQKVAEFREELMKAGFERITGQIQRIYNSQ